MLIYFIRRLRPKRCRANTRPSDHDTPEQSDRRKSFVIPHHYASTPTNVGLDRIFNFDPVRYPQYTSTRFDVQCLVGSSGLKKEKALRPDRSEAGW